MLARGLGQLLALGFIRKVWKRDQRRDYFEAEVEIWGLMSMAYERVVKIRAHEAKRQLGMVQETLNAERNDMPAEEYILTKERLESLWRTLNQGRKNLGALSREVAKMKKANEVSFAGDHWKRMSELERRIVRVRLLGEKLGKEPSRDGCTENGL